jgi:predicted DNA-binding protein
MMTARRPVKPKAEERMLRASVSFPLERHDTLERIARHKTVSVAWVVREAAEEYVANQWPLFGAATNGSQHHA